MATWLMDVRTNFVQRGTTGSSMFDHMGHLCRGTRIQTSGHSDLGILSNLGTSSNYTHDGISRYCISCLSTCASWQSCNNIHDFCSSHLGRRRALFSLACQSQNPSTNTDKNTPFSQWAPESSFTVPPRSRYCIDSALMYFWYWILVPTGIRILEVTHVHQCGKALDFPRCLCVLPR